METSNKEEYEDKVPEVVKNEPDDKPAGRGIMWAIAIAVIVLTIIYFMFFKDDVGF